MTGVDPAGRVYGYGRFKEKIGHLPVPILTVIPTHASCPLFVQRNSGRCVFTREAYGETL